MVNIIQHYFINCWIIALRGFFGGIDLDKVMDREVLLLGIDVGSTTVKVVVKSPDSDEVLFSRYLRHNARQCETAIGLLKEVSEKFPGVKFRSAVCGSGGKPVAEAAGIQFIQEVVANAAAVKKLYPDVRTAIELGGQDAKVVFFHKDEHTGELMASDMRMNGSCAGGTGAFIDEIAKLLGVKTEEFESLAEKGSTVFDISGRCGVFAKTDIQPLLIQGAKREDIALSSFHAIAKQTIGGLSQGLELKPPIIFEGGPLTFNPTLIKVFAERLNLSESDIVIPDHPETIVAYGTAIAAERLSGDEVFTADELISRLEAAKDTSDSTESAPPFFKDSADREEFESRHNSELRDLEEPIIENGVLRVYIGIDSGSTTSKLVLMDEHERIVDRFYSNNNGEPLRVICKGLSDLEDKYAEQGIRLEILGVGTTGYGEQLFASAFNADYHIVETVAHSQGCLKYFPDADFLLDIGGQDMKAIWLKNGVITNMTLNEACSSGCGSFLENFASSLGIKVEDIAESAFRSEHPAHLGSRCTVFMNSTIINEQRNGKLPDDIMAGLCRSIIENVFTKVVRISNTDELGSRVVVQGGTFRNFAVLKAIEDYLGKNVTLSPYPGEMGAVGAAILTRRKMKGETHFIGLDAVRNFDYTTETGVACPHCANHCKRTITRFSSGRAWVTGNRCERGAELEGSVPLEKPKKVPDMFIEREQLLFKDYDFTPVREPVDLTVGLPRVLEFWDSMPFWSTFFKALGYKVKFSSPSSRNIYESGISFVASDTICFPAKLAHGHIADLAKKGAQRIFMPYVMHMPPEGVDKQSPYVCSVVQGYPMVVKNSQNPAERYGVVFDTPIFHWFSEKNRHTQICEYAVKELGATEKEAEQAFAQAESAIKLFRKTLTDRAAKIMEDVKREGKFAVVLAGRPYHTDRFISHDISKKFTEKGVPVLTADSLPGLNEVDLHNTRAEITNDFHTRMLASAVIAAKEPELEYVQLVSFGCGHDAILSDEIIRIMTTTSDKPPLILKIDESDASGSLGIRVQSFIETVDIRRNLHLDNPPKPLPAPSPAKFYKKDKKIRTLLIPNISEEVSILLQAICEKEGFIVKTIPVGGPYEISLGKKYVHNDICFPCQMVIGELIGELQKGNYKQDEVAVGMVKFQCDCRMSHYAGLLRKGLDSAGFTEVPILTTDGGDSKDMHPGVFLLGVSAVLEAVWVFMMMDILTDIARKIRPYELNPGETDRVYMSCINKLADGIKKSIKEARKAFSETIDDMAKIPYDRSKLKPAVFVTGELLVTYHPGSNFHIERYLESNGMEAIFPRVTDQLRKDFLATMSEISDYKANIFPYPFAVDFLFNYVQDKLEKVAVKHPLYEKVLSPNKLYDGVSDIIPKTLSCGEGWLMAAEIDHYAEKGVKSFIILQPFGCLPNHICGRGVIKSLKDKHPDISILPLDLDPDTSLANVENRLQMLIMNTASFSSSVDSNNEQEKIKISV